MAEKNITQIELLRKKLEETDSDVLRGMLGYLIEQFMNADVDTICGAGYGRGLPIERILGTVIGRLELCIPEQGLLI